MNKQRKALDGNTRHFSLKILSMKATTDSEQVHGHPSEITHPAPKHSFQPHAPLHPSTSTVSHVR